MANDWNPRNTGRNNNHPGVSGGGPGRGGYPRNESHDEESHFSLGEEVAKCLLSLLLSLGMGLFWYSLARGIEEHVICFIAGILLFLLGAIHVVIGIKKDVEYRKRARRRW